MITIKEKGNICKPTDFSLLITEITDRHGGKADLGNSLLHFEFFDQDTHAKLMKNCKAEIDLASTYIVSFDGAERKNCSFENGELRFIFENYPFCETSNLYYRQKESYPNNEYSDFSEDVYSTGRIPVSIKSTGENLLPSTEFAASLSIIGGEGGGGVPASTIQQWDADVLKEAKAYTDGTVGVIETVLETI